MPREQQKRGRRAAEKAKKNDSKRKRDDAGEAHAVKRRKPSPDEIEMGDYVPLEEEGYQEQERGPVHADDTPFYGLLDSEEQEYFSRANEVLELNQFADAEERRLFIESVYREANGKELKVACSQSCSRLLEKLISLSDIEQIRRLFNKFIGHFLHLVQHRFASHCCETLFIHAAPGVSQKATKSQRTQTEKSVDGGVDGADAEPQLSLAQMFLKVVEELESNWGYLLTERFASHTVRVLLLVLSGEHVDVSSNDSVVASRKKERLTVPGLESQSETAAVQRRRIPDEFESTLQHVMKAMVAGLDDTYFRALATHPIGNPVLQVLMYLELAHFGKSTAKEPTSITRRLIPDDSFEEGSESTKFVQGLLYDPVGSRLLETIVRWAPGKLFKNLYKNLFRERIGSLARNVTAGYVVVRILERLGKDDLQSAVDRIIPEIPSLIERSRLIVPRILVERCAVRGVDTIPLAKALEAAYEKDPARRLLQMLKLQTVDLDQTEQPGREDKKKDNDGSPAQHGPKNAERLHGSLLAQSMICVSGPLSELIFSGLLAQSSDWLVVMSKDPTASRVLQSALTQPTSTLQFRRQFTARFHGHLKDLALDASGSHVVDALWTATRDIFFVKERMADELVQNEFALRDSFIGRAVWRNWSLDLYKRRRGEWKAKAKGLDQSSDSARDSQHERPKSKLDLARARYASKVGGQGTEPDVRPVLTES